MFIDDLFQKKRWFMYVFPHIGPDLLRSQFAQTNLRAQSRILRVGLNRGLRVIY